MKKLNLFFTLLIGLTILSCSSDDDNGNQTDVSGELIVNGQSFELTKGYIIPNTPQSDPRRFYFSLTNGDMTYENNEFTFSDNITQLIDFNMYSSVEGDGDIENTTYPIYDFSDPNFDSDNAWIDHSGVNTNVVIENGNYVSTNSLSSDDMDGQATIIINNNDTYTITFSYTNNQNIVSGTFTGPLINLLE
ncbi:hypothetical protein [uncultured Algibacter sp.]|uniref:hypothetical protein n=1 Tax=uncultured Algibacter sp. TaxID=298659 RepID=UPI00261CDA64|nr:hypothetical protein [uncultured Algibacter sp.]